MVVRFWVLLRMNNPQRNIHVFKYRDYLNVKVYMLKSGSNKLKCTTTDYGSSVSCLTFIISQNRDKKRPRLFCGMSKSRLKNSQNIPCFVFACTAINFSKWSHSVYGPVLTCNVLLGPHNLISPPPNISLTCWISWISYTEALTALLWCISVGQEYNVQ